MNQALSPIGGLPSLAEMAYQQIRDAIVRGQLQSGQRLVYRALAEELGISPTPVRDAIQRLASDGALQLGERGTAIVPIITASHYIEIINLRLALEGMAAQEVATQDEGRDEIISSLVATHERLAQSKLERNVDGALFENERFHSLYLRAARMPVLEDLVRSLWLRCGPSVRLLYTDGYTPPVRHPHLRLIEALRNADPDEARLAVEEDLKRAAAHIITQLDPDADIPPHWLV